MCCSLRKVLPPSNKVPSKYLRTLCTGESVDANHFPDNFNRCNACFQMTSTRISKEIRVPGFIPTHKVHPIECLNPLQNKQAKFLQVYFIGNGQQQEERRFRNVNKTKQKKRRRRKKDNTTLHYSCIICSIITSYVHSLKSEIET